MTALSNTYSIRCVFQWTGISAQEKRNLYEERITLWNARNADDAIALAEKEAVEYAKDIGTFLEYSLSYWIVEDWILPTQGIEVFSLLRESDLAPEEYINTFFDTGYERAQSEMSEE